MTTYTASYQVTRSRFDHLLLDHCRTLGAEVREGHSVKDVQFTSAGARVTIQNSDGTLYESDAQLFADATGRDTFMTSRMRHKRMDPLLKKVAFFGYFEGARREAGRARGNTLTVVIHSGWIWFIPLEDDVVSVGLVLDAEDAKIAKDGSADALYDDMLSRVPVIAERLTGANRVSAVRVTSDFSYASEKLYGDRYVVLGDAGFFLDPVFSSGVHLAILSGIRGAEAMHDRLEGGSLLNPFRRYQREMRRRQGIYFKFIYGWYRPGFLELFFSPTEKFKMLDAIVSLLSGEPANWRVRMRMQLLFLLAQLNRIFPLAPSINRAALPGAVRPLDSDPPR